MDQVVFVCAPFFSVVRPALGVSLLKAALRKRGIPSTIRYLNVEFADRIGANFHESAATGAANTLLVGEWIFSSLLHEEADTAQQAQYRKTLELRYSPEHLQRLESIRDQARLFVKDKAGELAAASPRVLGFTSSFQQNCASLAIAKYVRVLNPAIMICIGGANCEGPMGEALLENYPQIDYVFSGESDSTFPEFVECVLADRPVPSNESIITRHGKGIVNLGGGLASNRVENIDDLPHPCFSDYFTSLDGTHYRARILPSLVFESSRGCWWGAKKHCRFCGLNGQVMRYRTKSPQRVIEEIAALSDEYGVSQFLAVDNIMDLKHIENVFGTEALSAGKWSFFYEVKANLTRAQMKTLARAGVRWLQPGIESLDDDLLRSMEKGVTALQNICVLRNAVELGIRVTWTILHGFPGETDEQYRSLKDMIPLLEHLEPPNGCVPIRLDRFSPYFERSAEFGFTDVHPAMAYAAVYGLPEPALAKLAYYFEDRQRTPCAVMPEVETAASAWERAWFQHGAPPTLESSEFADGSMVEDTRSCSLQRWRYLSSAETAVLEAFREPRAIKSVLANRGGDGSAILESLISWRYLLIDKDRALSLVSQRDPQMAAMATRSEYPGGYLSPPIAVVQPAAS